MARRKIAAYFVFLLHRKEQLKRAGKEISNDEVDKLVSEEWNALSDDERAKYRTKAMTENGRMRSAQRNMQELISFADLSPTRQMFVQATNLLSRRAGARRTGLLHVEFVSCCISPLFVHSPSPPTLQDANNRPLSSENGIVPLEICLVRWSISAGPKEIYKVNCDIRKPFQGVHTVISPTTNLSANANLCSDLDRIAEEVHDFLDDTAFILTRNGEREHTIRCLQSLFDHNADIIQPSLVALDSAIVLHQLLTTHFKGPGEVLPLDSLREKFELHSSGSPPEHSTEMQCWHSDQDFCAVRRAVEDTFVILAELGSASNAVTAKVVHVPGTSGQLSLRQRLHRCRHPTKELAEVNGHSEHQSSAEASLYRGKPGQAQRPGTELGEVVANGGVELHSIGAAQIEDHTPFHTDMASVALDHEVVPARQQAAESFDDDQLLVEEVMKNATAHHHKNATLTSRGNGEPSPVVVLQKIVAVRAPRGRTPAAYTSCKHWNANNSVRSDGLVSFSISESSYG